MGSTEVQLRDKKKPPWQPWLSDWRLSHHRLDKPKKFAHIFTTETSQPQSKSSKLQVARCTSGGQNQPVQLMSSFQKCLTTIVCRSAQQQIRYIHIQTQSVCREGTDAFILHTATRLQTWIIWYIYALSELLCTKRRDQRSHSMRPPGERCSHRHWKQVNFSVSVLWYSDLSVFPSALTGIRCVQSVPLPCNVAFLAQNDLWSLHRFCSILSSYHPLPTTKWRLTLQRPDV